jgi:A/G-specific adenine glycosylase
MNKRERQFVAVVWEYYRQYGRHDLPWRKTQDPYQIVISEMMLQQTQVERVVPKYRAFLKEFPTARRLAAAPLRDVLHVWQGLGYNRRAKFLWQTAQQVMNDWKGKWPMDESGLRSLPGIGLYTASAVMAFAHNHPTVLIETNVRQVFLHHFFKNKREVPDTDILKLVEKTLLRENPREWYWALMDYGAHLKKEYGNINHTSKHYSKQSTFKGSDRQIRGAIIKVLTRVQTPLTKKRLHDLLIEAEPRLAQVAPRVAKQLAELQEEGFVTYAARKYQLA